MSRPTQARISVSALLHNLNLLRRSLTGGARLMAVVKANCYGHEADICVPALQQAGVEIFGVATVWEARLLRKMGVNKRIVLLTTPFETEADAFPELDLEPLISDRKSAEWLSARADAAGTRLRGHIYVDTGMTRNGSAPQDVPALLAAVDSLPGLTIQGIGSHFATSEEADTSYARRQIATFDATLRRGLDEGYAFRDVHIANSGGILNFPQAHYTLVRPGIALYGYHPDAGRQESSGLLPVMTLRTAISSIRPIPAGTDVSYGRRYTTARDTLIATLPIGYGDGLMRRLTGNLDVLIGGKRFPVVGTICMDEVMVDLGPDANVFVGDEVILIGRSEQETITAWEPARGVGTIPYEITSAVAPRVPRVGE